MDVEAIKQGQRAMWGLGDYPDLARHIQAASDEAATAVGAGEGTTLLDVATGSGNAAIAAARRGAIVTGLDLSPDLLAHARARAGDEGLDVEWIEGDAEALPFADASFDLATSVFGAMFAPRHEVAASELVRVVRPGGAFAVAAWTPEGTIGRTFGVMAQHMPPPPPEMRPPLLWGTEEHMRGLFGDDAQLEFRRGVVRFQAASVDAWMEYNERVLPPMVAMRAGFAERPEEWRALQGGLREVYESAGEERDGAMHFEGEYLLTVGRL
jgi:ubiquinone/menaquinone biosynthesis C-methylase UbiE